MAARRKTLQNSNDDYPKIVDFISRFAVHHMNVNFSCRKVGKLLCFLAMLISEITVKDTTNCVYIHG